jgi:hypothetical protein
MFRRRKNRPWYLKTVGILVIIRIIYGFAKFFKKASYKQAYPKKPDKRRLKR